MKKIIFLFIITFILPSFAMEQSKEALFNAIERNDINEVKKLIESEGKISRRDKNGDTPLMLAVKQKNVAIIKEILNELPDLDVENKEGKIAIEIAQALPEKSEADKTVKTKIIDLLKLAEIQDDFDNAIRELHPDLDNVVRLINAGASVNIPTHQQNPLFMAIKNKNLKLVKLLIQHGANVNQHLKYMDYFPFPLFYAVSSRHGFPNSTPEIIKVLLDNGANPNAVGIYGVTPLIEAVVDGGNINAVQLLLKAGADRSKKDRLQGENALDRAQKGLREVTNKLAKATEDEKRNIKKEKKNYEDIIKLLIGEKVSTYRENLLQALQKADINALKKLITHSFDIQDAIDLAIQENYLEGMKAILATFTDMYGKDARGDTLSESAIYDAIRHKELSAVNVLINYVDVNTPNKRGMTPLMEAAKYSTPAIVQVLLQKGANPNVIGGFEKQTPLIYAIKQKNIDVIATLLNANADPLLKNAKGKDAFDIAQKELDELADSSERVKRRMWHQQEKQLYENIVKLIESKIPPAILEQKREQKRQKQVAEEQARQQKEREKLAEAERQRQAAEEQARQEQERQRIAQEAEEARLAQERVRLAQEEERKRQERLRQEQLTRERLEQEKLEQQKREQEREQERLKAEQQRLEREKLAELERLTELERQRQARETPPIPVDDKPLISALHNLTQTLRVLQQNIIIS